MRYAVDAVCVYYYYHMKTSRLTTNQTKRVLCLVRSAAQHNNKQ